MDSPFDIAADLDTPVSAYLKLKPFKPRFLLESVENGEHLARYSFIGFGDGPTLELSTTAVRRNGIATRRPTHRHQWLSLMRETLAASPTLAPAVPELPFSGGLVGLAGYDIVRYFERLPAATTEPDGTQTSTPIAAYVAPESLLVFDHLTRRVALLHAGSKEERLALRADIVTALGSAIPPSAASGRFSSPQPTMPKERFITAVGTAQDYIRAGDIYQMVLSERFSGQTDLDPFQIYRGLRLLNPSPYMYFFELGGLRVAGSSPEALVRLDGATASLSPIAGTRPRGKTPDEDQAMASELLADPKENAEHVMLVDLARNDLGRVASTGSVHVEPYRNIERYSHVMHMVSGVQGELAAGQDAFDLFAAAFPAGTLVGAPKVRAMELIDELEPVPRGLYGGTIGYFANSGNMDQAITIRTIVFNGDQYSFQAGAGIVADSIPENEYQEVLAKSAVLRQALALAEEGL